MKPKVIKTKAAYEAALARAAKLMDAKPRTPQADELELLSLLIEDYEEKVFPIEKPDPVEAIRFRMSQQGLTYLDAPADAPKGILNLRNMGYWLKDNRVIG